MNGKKIAVTPSAYSYPLLINSFCTRRWLRPRARRLSIAMYGASPTLNCAIASAGWRALLKWSGCARAIPSGFSTGTATGF